MRRYNLKLNPGKSVFGEDNIHYLGYSISGEGIRQGEEKMKAIEEFLTPDSPKKICEFVGLANYFRFLLPNFSAHSAKLTDLFKKELAYKPGPLPEEAQQAFKALQAGLVSNPLVAYPWANKDFILTTDAATGNSENAGGMGAVLSQLHEDGSKRVIAYASRGLKANEKNYSVYLLKQAAAAWAISNFAVYLYGRRFTLYTDHKPLETQSAPCTQRCLTWSK